MLAADFEDSATGLNHPISGSTPIANDAWHHAAATYDGTTWRLYLDGQLEATQVEGAFTPRSDTTQDAGLGVMLMSNGNPANTARFQGTLDEARVWSGARNLSQIRSTINAELTSGTGLLARWGMSEATGSTVADSIATTANGTIPVLARPVRPGRRSISRSIRRHRRRRAASPRRRVTAPSA